MDLRRFLDPDRWKRWKGPLALILCTALLSALAAYGAMAVVQTREAERRMRFETWSYLRSGEELISAVRTDGEAGYRHYYPFFATDSGVLFDRFLSAKGAASTWKVDEAQYEHALVFLSTSGDLAAFTLPHAWSGTEEERAAVELLEDYLAILDRADRNSRDPRDLKSLLERLEADEEVPVWLGEFSGLTLRRRSTGYLPW